jgi:hypothetical protein
MVVIIDGKRLNGNRRFPFIVFHFCYLQKTKVCSKQTEVAVFPLVPFSVCGILDTWRHGDMGSWRHGDIEKSNGKRMPS